MALRGLINNNISSAFRLIGDLGTTVTLSTQVSTGYNFSTGTATTSAAVSTDVTAIVGNFTRNTANNSIEVEITMRASDVSGFEAYDTASFNGATYSIISYTVDDFLIVARLSRSA